jgi:uncharacterized alkaline shock family protein YloU
MAEYITQSLDNGAVMISEDVIVKIVLHALTDIEGYAGITAKPGMDIIDLIGGKGWGKSVRVDIGENNQLAVECNVLVYYGHSVMTVANALQEAALNALNAMTGLEKISVHVNVCGIVRQ